MDDDSANLAEDSDSQASECERLFRRQGIRSVTGVRLTKKSRRLSYNHIVSGIQPAAPSRAESCHPPYPVMRGFPDRRLSARTGHTRFSREGPGCSRTGAYPIGQNKTFQASCYDAQPRGLSFRNPCILESKLFLNKGGFGIRLIGCGKARHMYAPVFFSFHG
jgi:hypothetical protein